MYFRRASVLVEHVVNVLTPCCCAVGLVPALMALAAAAVAGHGYIAGGAVALPARGSAIMCTCWEGAAPPRAWASIPLGGSSSAAGLLGAACV